MMIAKFSGVGGGVDEGELGKKSGRGLMRKMKIDEGWIEWKDEDYCDYVCDLIILEDEVWLILFY